jgi:ABC-2 type transport system permease protein
VNFYLIKIRIKRAFKSISKMSKFNLFSYSLVIGAFFVGGFIFFYRLFIFLAPIEVIGMIVADKLIAYSFFIFFLLLLMSNGITALSTLYYSEELDYLHSTPLLPSNIFTIKLIETVFYSSWATLIGAIPLISSYLISFGKMQSSMFLILIPLLAFIAIPAGLGVSIIMGLKKINPRFTLKQLAAILIGFSISLIYLYVQTTPYNFNIPQTLNLEAINKFMDGLRVSNPYFPNEWFYKSASALANNNFSLYLKNTGLLISGSIISISLAFLLAILFYRISWMSSLWRSDRHLYVKKVVFNRISQFFNLVQKDFKIFLRAPLQWSQLLIIGVLLIIYTISLRRTPLYVRDPFWLSAFALVNTGFIGYITATLSLRFVYPQMSLEGRTWWILRSSPLSTRTILHTKGWSFLLINLLIAEIVVITSNLKLVNYPFIVFISAIVTAIFSFTAVALGVSLGTIFAEFNETNPAKIASGAGGLLTASVSLIYIAVSLILFFMPISTYIKAQLEGLSYNIRIPLAISSIIFLIFTSLTILIPYRIAVKKINEI